MPLAVVTLTHYVLLGVYWSVTDVRCYCQKRVYFFFKDVLGSQFISPTRLSALFFTDVKQSMLSTFN